MTAELKAFYKKLYCFFGPQRWWPADSSFEVMVGAILTQGTNWANVEKAIANLKRESVLKPKKLKGVSLPRLARLIRPAGYYNIKAGRLREFLDFLNTSYGANLEKMASVDTQALRKQLLSVKGIGPETADSILLYALNKPTFVVDAYTKRVLLRHGLIKDGASYEEVQKLFMQNIKKEVKLYNEYHALLVKLGKEFCFKSKPACRHCPLS